MLVVNAVGVSCFVMLVTADPIEVLFNSSVTVRLQLLLLLLYQYVVTTTVPVAIDWIDVKVSERKVFDAFLKFVSMVGVSEVGADWIMSRSVHPNVVELRK